MSTLETMAWTMIGRLGEAAVYIVSPISFFLVSDTLLAVSPFIVGVALMAVGWVGMVSREHISRRREQRMTWV